jgi:hypothetical protein
MEDEPTPLEEQLSEEAQGAFEDAMASWESPSMDEPADATLSVASIVSEEFASGARSEPKASEVGWSGSAGAGPDEFASGEVSIDPSGKTVAIAQPVTAAPARPEETPTPVEPMAPDAGASSDRMRMPTQSEIIRAVDAVPTIPVQADQAFLDRIAAQRVEVESVPSPAADPTEPELAEPSTADLPPSPAAAPTIEVAAPKAPSPAPEPRSALPLIAVILAVVVAVMLAVLMLREP